MKIPKQHRRWFAAMLTEFRAIELQAKKKENAMLRTLVHAKKAYTAAGMNRGQIL